MPIVFDHFGNLQASLGVSQPGFSDLVELVRSGKAYVKISAAYHASKKPDFADPYVVPRGSTVLDVAEKVHRDFVDNLKYARLWSEGKPEGIMVPREAIQLNPPLLQM